MTKNIFWSQSIEFWKEKSLKETLSGNMTLWLTKNDMGNFGDFPYFEKIMFKK